MIGGADESQGAAGGIRVRVKDKQPLVVVVFIYNWASTDSRFRAFDSRTGKQLWMAELAASAHGAPMAYVGKTSGKQFIAGGGAGFFRGKISDEVVAYTLPNQ